MGRRKPLFVFSFLKKISSLRDPNLIDTSKKVNKKTGSRGAT